MNRTKIILTSLTIATSIISAVSITTILTTNISHNSNNSINVNKTNLTDIFAPGGTPIFPSNNIGNFYREANESSVLVTLKNAIPTLAISDLDLTININPKTIVVDAHPNSILYSGTYTLSYDVGTPVALLNVVPNDTVITTGTGLSAFGAEPSAEMIQKQIQDWWVAQGNNIDDIRIDQMMVNNINVDEDTGSGTATVVPLADGGAVTSVIYSGTTNVKFDYLPPKIYLPNIFTNIDSLEFLKDADITANTVYSNYAFLNKQINSWTGRKDPTNFDMSQLDVTLDDPQYGNSATISAKSTSTLYQGSVHVFWNWVDQINILTLLPRYDDIGYFAVTPTVDDLKIRIREQYGPIITESLLQNIDYAINANNVVLTVLDTAVDYTGSTILNFIVDQRINIPEVVQIRKFGYIDVTPANLEAELKAKIDAAAGMALDYSWTQLSTTISTNSDNTGTITLTPYVNSTKYCGSTVVITFGYNNAIVPTDFFDVNFTVGPGVALATINGILPTKKYLLPNYNTLDIPKTITDPTTHVACTVTTIAPRAFQDLEDTFTQVNLYSETLKSIGAHAFEITGTGNTKCNFGSIYIYGTGTDNKFNDINYDDYCFAGNINTSFKFKYGASYGSTFNGFICKTTDQTKYKIGKYTFYNCKNFELRSGVTVDATFADSAMFASAHSFDGIVTTSAPCVNLDETCDYCFANANIYANLIPANDTTSLTAKNVFSNTTFSNTPWAIASTNFQMINTADSVCHTKITNVSRLFFAGYDSPLEKSTCINNYNNSGTNRAQSIWVDLKYNGTDVRRWSLGFTEKNAAMENSNLTSAKLLEYDNSNSGSAATASTDIAEHAFDVTVYRDWKLPASCMNIRHWFEYCKRIGDYAFYMNKSVLSINHSQSDTRVYSLVGAHAFDGCVNNEGFISGGTLTNNSCINGPVSINNGSQVVATKMMSYIGDYAYGSNKITTPYIWARSGDLEQTIGSFAFSGFSWANCAPYKSTYTRPIWGIFMDQTIARIPHINIDSFWGIDINSGDADSKTFKIIVQKPATTENYVTIDVLRAYLSSDATWMAARVGGPTGPLALDCLFEQNW